MTGNVELLTEIQRAVTFRAMNTTASPLARAIAEVGLRPMATALGISYQAILKWESRRRLPRTEWTGETAYATRIAELCAHKVTRDELLAKWPEPTPEAAGA